MASKPKKKLSGYENRQKKLQKQAVANCYRMDKYLIGKQVTEQHSDPTDP
jgi:hypothetical protein